MFTTEYTKIIEQVKNINPLEYGRTRNFIDGAVTHLSPYISRGVISTRQVMEHALSQGYYPFQIEKFLQELAWRDYWQQVWIEKGEGINNDLRHEQPDVLNHEMPEAIVKAQTGISAIDTAITDFYDTGYVHNHLRMYIASLACNVGKSHWKVPAQWMYYYLLDGDWASNALSWQWVAGSNSNKKYWANQENINKYCHTNQKGTFLDVSYEDLPNIQVPNNLQSTTMPELKTKLPATNFPDIDSSLPILIYNAYNLDPKWKQGIKANRILLLEPSHFSTYPMSAKTIEFILRLAENINGIQCYVGEFSEIVKAINPEAVFFKEHPFNSHYKGNEEPRDWMFEVKGYFPSFFAFWKLYRKELAA